MERAQHDFCISDTEHQNDGLLNALDGGADLFKANLAIWNRVYCTEGL